MSNVTMGVLTLIAVALVGGVVWWFSATSGSPAVLYEDGEMRPYTSRPSGQVIHTTYDCPNGDMFITNYDLGSNEITLETDARDVYVLPQSVSEEGARYAMFDGSVIFYEEAGTATVIVNDELLHEACVPLQL